MYLILFIADDNDLGVAMGSINSLIVYLDLLQVSSNHGQFKLCRFDLKQFMRLDSAAIQALHLTAVAGDALKNNNMNLYGLLNKCKTSQGSRLLSQWIRQPLLSVDLIEQRLDIVSVFSEESDVRLGIHEVRLKTFPDLYRICKKLKGAVNTTSSGNGFLQDVIRLYQVIVGLPGLIDRLQSSIDTRKVLKKKFVEPLVLICSKLEKLKEMVETTIDLEAADMHEYLIKPDFHPELLNVRHKMDQALHEMQPEAESVARDLNVDFEKKLKFESSPQYGHHLRLSRAEAALIRGNKNYFELATQKAGVLFTTLRLKGLSEEYIQLSADYKKVQFGVVKEIIGIVATYSPILEDLNDLIAELDVLVSFAVVAKNAPIEYARPVLAEGTEIILKGSRHPCVEMQDLSFIENDVELIEHQSSFHIITGPNMGGKSTFIRQVGVICLMAQIGSFVPCEYAKIRIVDAILARVGAGDNQLNGVSTFMNEMLETRSILESATEKSLVIIDELGRGTSTSDGFGLAYAIAEYFRFLTV